MTTPAWAAYKDYDAQATVLAKLTMARQFAAELRAAITADYQADGLSVRNQSLLSLLDRVQADIERYERASRPSRVVPIRSVPFGGTGGRL